MRERERISGEERLYIRVRETNSLSLSRRWQRSHAKERNNIWVGTHTKSIARRVWHTHTHHVLRDVQPSAGSSRPHTPRGKSSLLGNYWCGYEVNAGEKKSFSLILLFYFILFDFFLCHRQCTRFCVAVEYSIGGGEPFKIATASRRSSWL